MWRHTTSILAPRFWKIFLFHSQCCLRPRRSTYHSAQEEYWILLLHGRFAKRMGIFGPYIRGIQMPISNHHQSCRISEHPRWYHSRVRWPWAAPPGQAGRRRCCCRMVAPTYGFLRPASKVDQVHAADLRVEPSIFVHTKTSDLLSRNCPNASFLWTGCRNLSHWYCSSQDIRWNGKTVAGKRAFHVAIVILVFKYSSIFRLPK